MGGCVQTYRSFKASDFQYQVSSLEKSFPFAKITLQDFEERVKRLVFEDDDDQISLAQL